ncbi:MAG: hypothetical protein L3J42_06640 [Hydrogenimonas sp.]|nr:hypothetical protein [Hydrogenimonas sp.]
MLGIEVKRMVEFKAAYTSLWPERERYWPEVIFHGKRGTPKGMAQFTPYPGGYVQLHGMSEDITLFKGGLARSEDGKAQPKLPDKFLGLIEKGWPHELIESRTKRAVEFAARFMPPFLAAKPGGPPLFGAQQIPGEDPTLRVAEVSFDRPRYARCEIVKVSSVTDMAEAIVEDLIAERLCDSKLSNWNGTSLFEQIDEKSIGLKAANIAKSRGYPEDMAALNIDSEDI